MIFVLDLSIDSLWVIPDHAAQDNLPIFVVFSIFLLIAASFQFLKFLAIQIIGIVRSIAGGHDSPSSFHCTNVFSHDELDLSIAELDWPIDWLPMIVL